MNFQRALKSDYDPAVLANLVRLLPTHTDDELYEAIRILLAKEGKTIDRAKVPKIRAGLMVLSSLLPATSSATVVGERPFPPPNWIDDLTGWRGEEHGWLTPSGWRDCVNPKREGEDCGEDGRASDGRPSHAFDLTEAVAAWAADPEATAAYRETGMVMRHDLPPAPEPA